jgi:hypothetical protein
MYTMAQEAAARLEALVKQHGAEYVVKMFDAAEDNKAYRKRRQQTEKDLLRAAKSDKRFMETAGARVLAKKSA